MHFLFQVLDKVFLFSEYLFSISVCLDAEMFTLMCNYYMA